MLMPGCRAVTPDTLIEATQTLAAVIDGGQTQTLIAMGTIIITLLIMSLHVITITCRDRKHADFGVFDIPE